MLNTSNKNRDKLFYFHQKQWSLLITVHQFGIVCCHLGHLLKVPPAQASFITICLLRFNKNQNGELWQDWPGDVQSIPLVSGACGGNLREDSRGAGLQITFLHCAKLATPFLKY